jgi:hypothetical protein
MPFKKKIGEKNLAEDVSNSKKVLTNSKSHVIINPEIKKGSN